MMDHSAIQEKIALFAKTRETIAAVYLFGSAATGRARSGSDLDIALIVNDPLSKTKQMEWENELCNILRKEVDLVVFNQVAPLLKHQILKYGQLMYEACPRARVFHETRARREYLDSRYLYKTLRRSNG